MRIPLDPLSKIPLYRQIETWLQENILNGSLQPETRLPATRVLSEKLGVSRITIKNAYANLESGGLIHTRMGSGTYVSQPETPAPTSLPHWPLWQAEALPQGTPEKESTDS